MLSAITLGLRALQMILAMALLGLSVSILAQNLSCWTVNGTNECDTAASYMEKNGGPRKSLIRYGTFLGAYGILISAIGTVSLFVESIPAMISLVGDGLGLLFFLSGGIAWAVQFGNFRDNYGIINFICTYDYSGYEQEDAQIRGVCRRYEAEHGLVWALFAITAGLAICNYFRRRDQKKSLR